MKAMKVRPRIQRAFLAWLDANKRRFAVRPLLKRRTDQILGVGFQGINSMVTSYLTRSELGVKVTVKDICWDIIACFESMPVRADSAYVCLLCEAGDRLRFSSLEDLWRDHLFEPFLQWANDNLKRDRWLVLYASPGGSTRAEISGWDCDNRCDYHAVDRLMVGWVADCRPIQPFGKCQLL